MVKNHITVYEPQWPAPDISLDPSRPMQQSPAGRLVRHLLKSPDAKVAIDGRYRRSPGDRIDYPPGILSYLVRDSDLCPDCARAASAG